MAATPFASGSCKQKSMPFTQVEEITATTCHTGGSPAALARQGLCPGGGAVLARPQELREAARCSAAGSIGLDAQHGLCDEEIDNQACSVTERGDERVRKHSGIRTNRLGHNRHEPTNGR